MTELLSDGEVAAALGELVGWSGDRTGLRRTVRAPDFATAIRVVDDVAERAEERDHHPDIDIRWRTLSFALTTHSKGGVTARDVELAREIDAAAARHGAA